MTSGRPNKRVVVKNYSGEASPPEIGYRILKIWIDGRERGIVFNAGEKVREDRDICKRKQG